MIIWPLSSTPTFPKWLLANCSNIINRYQGNNRKMSTNRQICACGLVMWVKIHIEYYDILMRRILYNSFACCWSCTYGKSERESGSGCFRLQRTPQCFGVEPILVILCVHVRLPMVSWCGRIAETDADFQNNWNNIKTRTSIVANLDNWKMCNSSFWLKWRLLAIQRKFVYN